MPITEYVMRAGEWSLELEPGTPRSVLEEVRVNSAGFSQIVILPARLDPTTVDDATMLSHARYVGTYRSQTDTGLGLAGAGLSTILGDEDGKGDVYESSRSTVNGWLSQWYTSVFPVGLLTGAITSPGGSYAGKFFLQTPREAWDILAGHFGVEWRVRHSLHFDVGTWQTLYGATPNVVILGASAGLSGGRDLGLTGVMGGSDLAVDLEDYTSKVVYLTGDRDAPTVTTAGGDSTAYRRPTGHPLIMDRRIEAFDDAGSPATGAAMQLGRFTLPRMAWSVETTGTYDLGRDCPIGSPVYLYDPATGLTGPDPVTYRGTQIYPTQTRVMGMTSPIRAGYGVYLRRPSGAPATYVDLTPHVRPETGSQRVDLGALPRPSR